MKDILRAGENKHDKETHREYIKICKKKNISSVTLTKNKAVIKEFQRM